MHRRQTLYPTSNHGSYSQYEAYKGTIKGGHRGLNSPCNRNPCPRIKGENIDCSSWSVIRSGSYQNHHQEHLDGCQNFGPSLGTLKIRCCIIVGIQKGAIILTTTHLCRNCTTTLMPHQRRSCRNHAHHALRVYGPGHTADTRNLLDGLSMPNFQNIEGFGYLDV